MANQYHTTHREKVLRVVAGANAEVRLATVAKRRLATEVFMVQIFGKILGCWMTTDSMTLQVGGCTEEVDTTSYEYHTILRRPEFKYLL